ncbi:iron-sulfur cluster assembly accessory protein [Candidatus Providencia siddallii]|uniref:Protein SufA n=1 Tax=Candidatus Providencia siddallii TaxID=1715285 RepID=A0ABP1CFZ6_9GAMM
MNDCIKKKQYIKKKWKGISITYNAAKQIKKIMTQNPNAKGILFNIKQYGCAGFGYIFEIIEKPTNNYLSFELDGTYIYSPKEAMPFIDGTIVDFVQEGLNQTFKFNNPKAQHACGCGHSFRV